MQTWDGQREFPPTNWADLLRLQGDESERTRLLNELAETYWSPVFRYVLARYRIPVEDAKDRTQAFFTDLLRRGSFETLSPERGHFRGFLKRSLQNFMIGEFRKDQVRRPADGPLLSLDAGPLEPAVLDEPPEAAFDAEWRRLVVGEALSRLEALLAAEGKPLYYRVFELYAIEPAREGRKPPAQRELAERFGLERHDIDNYLRHARRRAREILIGLVKGYVDPEAGGDIEAEVAFLLSD